MEKKSKITHFFTIYELIKVFFILKSNAGSDFFVLPLSWYVSIPLIILPFILCILIQHHPEENKVLLTLYVFTKIVSIISLAMYFVIFFQKAIYDVKIKDFYLLKNLIQVMLFFLFDVIILVIIFIKRICNKQTDGLECK